MQASCVHLTAAGSDGMKLHQEFNCNPWDQQLILLVHATSVPVLCTLVAVLMPPTQVTSGLTSNDFG
jgi:hypothetical protein